MTHGFTFNWPQDNAAYGALVVLCCARARILSPSLLFLLKRCVFVKSLIRSSWRFVPGFTSEEQRSNHTCDHHVSLCALPSMLTWRLEEQLTFLNRVTVVTAATCSTFSGNEPDGEQHYPSVFHHSQAFGQTKVSQGFMFWSAKIPCPRFSQT